MNAYEPHNGDRHDRHDGSVVLPGGQHLAQDVRTHLPRRLAFGRAVSVDLNEDAPSMASLDAAQPEVETLLARLVRRRGVRHVSLLTRNGYVVASEARSGDDPPQLHALAASLRAMSDQALQALGAGDAGVVTVAAHTLRIEMRVVEGGFLLVVAVEDAVPPERLQPVLRVALASLGEMLEDV